MSTPRVLIMAGGTGGHVYPALAVAGLLRDRGWLVDWVGTGQGLEARVVPDNEFPLHTLPVRGLRGKGIAARLVGVLRLLAALVAALRLVRRLKPDVTLGLGGYASGPAGIATWLLRRPLVIHEQNAVAGTTNRLLAPLARRVLSGLPGAFDRRREAEIVGNPVRQDIVAAGVLSDGIPGAFTAERPLQLLVLGGSLGSAPLNTAVPAAVGQLLDAGSGARLTIRHQCGERNLDATRAAWAEHPDASVAVFPFIDDMAGAYAWADLVVCRAGALTVSELAVTGTPSILVPLPHAIDDHQTRNALALSSHGAGQLLPQRELTPTRLARLLDTYLEHPGRLRVMAAAARSLGRTTATEAVADIVAEVAHVG